MKRRFLFSYVFTGHPASGCLPLLMGGFQYSGDLTHSFNKRGGETVDVTTGPHTARQYMTLGMPLSFSTARLRFKLEHTASNSTRNVHIEISRGETTR